MARCEGCGAEVYWHMHERTGKAAPVDPAPAPDGNVVLIKGIDDVVRYRVLTKAELEAAQGGALFQMESAPRYTLHFASCPNADHFRRDHIAHRLNPDER